MTSSKIKVLRIIEILSETDEQNPLTAKQIGEKLKLEGIEAERKSIARDLNILIDEKICGKNNRGYYSTRNKGF